MSFGTRTKSNFAVCKDRQQDGQKLTKCNVADAAGPLTGPLGNPTLRITRYDTLNKHVRDRARSYIFRRVSRKRERREGWNTRELAPISCWRLEGRLLTRYCRDSLFPRLGITNSRMMLYYGTCVTSERELQCRKLAILRNP